MVEELLIRMEDPRPVGLVAKVGPYADSGDVISVGCVGDAELLQVAVLPF